jgi:hypothetical protein
MDKNLLLEFWTLVKLKYARLQSFSLFGTSMWWWSEQKLLHSLNQQEYKLGFTSLVKISNGFCTCFAKQMQDFSYEKANNYDHKTNYQL